MRKYIMVALVLLAFTVLFVGFASAEDPWVPRIDRPDYEDSLVGWLSERWQLFLSYF